MWKIINLVSGAGIRTRNLLNMSCAHFKFCVFYLFGLWKSVPSLDFERWSMLSIPFLKVLLFIAHDNLLRVEWFIDPTKTILTWEYYHLGQEQWSSGYGRKTMLWGHGFESQRYLLDRYVIFHINYCKKCNDVWKDRKLTKKRPGIGHLYNVINTP